MRIENGANWVCEQVHMGRSGEGCGNKGPWTWILDKFELQCKIILERLLFDPAFLLISDLVLILPGPSKAKNNAGTQANDDQGDKIEKNEKPVSQVEQVFLEELEKLKSTNLHNSASTPLSTVGPSRAFTDGALSYPDPFKIDAQDDPTMPHLEDIYASPSEGIFTDSSYDADKLVTDFNNLETNVNVSPTPTTRMNKELASPKQTALGKDISNPLIADSLVKTICLVRYALTASPTIHTSGIKQFWSMAKVKTVNDEVRVHILIDAKRVNIKESFIRHTLKLDDEEDTSCLANDEIFTGLANMDFKKISDKLTL
nr:hypothetical protein [Tanacetum cinerariifolium]